jgi:hypothetical protein
VPRKLVKEVYAISMSISEKEQTHQITADDRFAKPSAKKREIPTGNNFDGEFSRGN